MSNSVYSDLPQVVPDSHFSELQTVVEPGTDTDTFKVYSNEGDTYKVYNDEQDTQKIANNDLDTQKVSYNASEPENIHANGFPATAKQRRIWGLPSRTFFIVTAIIIIVVIIAVIGGGVGGGLSSKKSSNQDMAHSTNTNTIFSGSTATPTTGKVSITTTKVMLPTKTLLRDCPSSNNSEYHPTASTPEKPMTFFKVCLRTWENSLGPGVNAVNTPATSLNDCINLCAAYNIANQTQITNGTGNVCNSVCWRWGAPADTYWPGQCYGFMTSNTTGAFNEVEDGWCDGARWTDQSFGRL
jgi:hypothetical protein